MRGILVDVDGVVADFLTSVLTRMVIEDPMVDAPDPEDITDFSFTETFSPRQLKAATAVIESPGFARYLAPITGADVGIATLRKYYGEVTFVTSPCHRSVTWVNDREWWLDKYFDVYPSSIIFTDSKELIRGGVLIDDKVANVEAFNRVNGAGGILYSQPWNRNYRGTAPVVTNWAGAVEKTRKFFLDQNK